MKNLFFLFLMIASNTLFSQNDADEKAIRNLAETISKGWSVGSGETFASAFEDHHDFIVWNGYYFKDMMVNQNAKAHTSLFEEVYKDTKLFCTVDKVKFISNDVALMHVFAAVSRDEERPENPQVLWTGIAHKKDGIWKLVSFHNLDLEVFEDDETKKNSPMPPQVMYASWYEND
ncbi:MAG: SgcJ/EcaC family oxidoreductase [Saprospiraceae bacterium]